MASAKKKPAKDGADGNAMEPVDIERLKKLPITLGVALTLDLFFSGGALAMIGYTFHETQVISAEVQKISAATSAAASSQGNVAAALSAQNQQISALSTSVSVVAGRDAGARD